MYLLYSFFTTFKFALELNLSNKKYPIFPKQFPKSNSFTYFLQKMHCSSSMPYSGSICIVCDSLSFVFSSSLKYIFILFKNFLFFNFIFSLCLWLISFCIFCFSFSSSSSIIFPLTFLIIKSQYNLYGSSRLFSEISLIKRFIFLFKLFLKTVKFWKSTE